MTDDVPDDHYWPSFAAWRSAYDDGVFDEATTLPGDLDVVLTLRGVADGRGGIDVGWVHAVHAAGSPEALAAEAACAGPALDFLRIHDEHPPPDVPSAVLLVCFTDVGAPASRGLIGPMGAPEDGCVPPTLLVEAVRRFLAAD